MGIEAFTDLNLSKAETPQPPLQTNTIPEQDVLDEVSRHFKVDLPEIFGQNRSRSIAYARHMAMFILKNSSRQSIADIGRKFGNRDHSTVISAIDKICMWLETGDEIAVGDYTQLMEVLKEKTQENDPAKESMNNFHCHMPGGIYRPTDDPNKGFIPKAMREYLKEFASFIDDDESAWPESADHEVVKAVKTKRDIQRAVDEVLASSPELSERWLVSQQFFAGGGKLALREFVLRPIYVALREKFTEDELSS